MGLETANYISELDAANPAGGDIKGLGDNHLRMIKGALKQQFPNFTPVAVNATVAELNTLVGVTAGVQAQLNQKAPLDSPVFTGNASIAGNLAVGGTASAATQVPPGDNSQLLASTNWVQAYISALSNLQLGLPVAPVQPEPLALFTTNGVLTWSPVPSRSRVFYAAGA
jgi:hypothetical protein